MRDKFITDYLMEWECYITEMELSLREVLPMEQKTAPEY